MTLRNSITLAIFSALTFSVLLATPTTVSAACSYNGYVNSNGRCAASSWSPRPFAFPQYNYSSYSMEQYISYLQQLIETLQDQLDEDVHYQGSVDAETRSAVDVDEDSASLRGRIDLNDEDKASVYFEYGASRFDLDKDSRKLTIDEEDDDDFKINITNLDDDTLYYFRVVAIDEDKDKNYGAILSFRTEVGEDDNDPHVETRSAISITDDSAELRGLVDMNDFTDGRVFFIYGEDEGEVEDVADDYDTYNDIAENGDDLQKMLVDSGLDSSALYTREFGGLDPDTRIYYTICVEYEDADDDDTLTCGSTTSFTTNS